MRDLLNAAEMKAVDQRSIEEYGIPSLVLMERAALEVVKRARELLEPGLSGNEALEHGPGRERLLKERKRKTVWAISAGRIRFSRKRKRKVEKSLAIGKNA